MLSTLPAAPSATCTAARRDAPARRRAAHGRRWSCRAATGPNARTCPCGPASGRARNRHRNGKARSISGRRSRSQSRIRRAWSTQCVWNCGADSRRSGRCGSGRGRRAIHRPAVRGHRPRQLILRPAMHFACGGAAERENGFSGSLACEPRPLALSEGIEPAASIHAAFQTAAVERPCPCGLWRCPMLRPSRRISRFPPPSIPRQ